MFDEGPGSGRWLVSNVRRNLHSQISEVTLARRRPTLPEPAPQTRQETIHVAGSPNRPVAPASSTRTRPTVTIGEKVFQAAREASALRWRYSQPRRNSNGQNQYADCSSGVTWVLRKAGVPTPPSSYGNAPVSGHYTSWGSPGRQSTK